VKRGLVDTSTVARISDEGFSWLPISAQHAWGVHDLPAHHRDPFDRLLLAQALIERLPIVTADSRFDDYERRRRLVTHP
jgi:PIN domain nuclease of toxin-antitoxin system